jgi:hypothetical protein
VRLLEKVQVPCRKWPSMALMRGSPWAVTVAAEITLIPVSRAAIWRAVSVRSSRMMSRRCSVDLACEASRSVWRRTRSSGVSSMLRR